MHLLDLPFDVLSSIVMALARNELVTLIRTCRVLNDVAHPRILHTVRLLYEANRVQSFCMLLKARPDLARHIHNFQLPDDTRWCRRPVMESPEDYELREAVLLMVNLRSIKVADTAALDYTNCDIFGVLQHCNQLTSVEFVRIDDLSFLRVFEFLRRAKSPLAVIRMQHIGQLPSFYRTHQLLPYLRSFTSSLTTLQITDVSLEGGYHSSDVFLAMQHLSLKRTSVLPALLAAVFPNLRTLFCEDVSDSTPEGTRPSFDHWSTLDMLRTDGRSFGILKFAQCHVTHLKLRDPALASIHLKDLSLFICSAAPSLLEITVDWSIVPELLACIHACGAGREVQMLSMTISVSHHADNEDMFDDLLVSLLMTHHTYTPIGITNKALAHSSGCCSLSQSFHKA